MQIIPRYSNHNARTVCVCVCVCVCRVRVHARQRNTGWTIRSCAGWSKIGHETATRTCSNPCASVSPALGVAPLWRLPAEFQQLSFSRIFGSVATANGAWPAVWPLALPLLSFALLSVRSAGSSFSSRSVFPSSRLGLDDSSDARHGDSRQIRNSFSGQFIWTNRQTRSANTRCNYWISIAAIRIFERLRRIRLVAFRPVRE